MKKPTQKELNAAKKKVRLATKKARKASDDYLYRRGSWAFADVAYKEWEAAIRELDELLERR